MQEDASGGTAELKIKIVDIEDDQVRNFQVPSFVNYVNLFLMGTEVYLDMGVVTIERLGVLKPGPEATAAIYGRFVMSPANFDELLGRMILLRDDLKAKGLVRTETLNAPKGSQGA